MKKWRKQSSKKPSQGSKFKRFEFQIPSSVKNKVLLEIWCLFSDHSFELCHFTNKVGAELDIYIIELKKKSVYYKDKEYMEEILIYFRKWI